MRIRKSLPIAHHVFYQMGSRCVEHPARRCSQSRSCSQRHAAPGRLFRAGHNDYRVSSPGCLLSHRSQGCPYVLIREVGGAVPSLPRPLRMYRQSNSGVCVLLGKGRMDASRLHPSSVWQLRAHRHLPAEPATPSLRSVHGSGVQPLSRPWSLVRLLMVQLSSTVLSWDSMPGN